MKNCRLALLWLISLGLLVFSTFGQEAATPRAPNLNLEALKLKDLKRTARRHRISVDQLANARTALREATDLAMQQDMPPTDCSTLARLWVQLDRKKSREVIGNLVATVCKQAEAAEDLATYGKSTSLGQQLLSVLNEVDPEKVSQIIDLWPAPAAKLGEPGQQALAQFQRDAVSRLAMMGSNMAAQSYEQYLEPQKSASLPFMPRIQIASSLMNSNQRDKAQAILDQAIVDFGKSDPDLKKTSDYDGFVRMLASVYPDKLMDALDIYNGLVSRQDNPNPGTIYESGNQKVLLTPSESLTLSVIRGIYGRPELMVKLLEANPDLRSKLAPLGGIDRVLSGSPMLSGSPPVRSYPANMPPPPPPPVPGGAGSSAGFQIDGSNPGAAAENRLDPNELFRTLRGKAEFNPEWVRRKLADACTKKEHFSTLITLAQIASSQDPDLGSVALEVARGLLTAFDSLQQQASSLRTLITISRQVDGEVDAGLIKQGFNLVSDMREEEKKRVQPQGGAQSPPPLLPSDDLEITLIAQTAVDDFRTALRRAHSLDGENVQMRALLQIAQSLMSYY